jgi:hypothetical protein
MLPDAASQDLIYIVDQSSDAVDVYSYPDRAKVGRLRERTPYGVCSDSASDVWVTEDANRLLEYAHGGTNP